MNAYQCLVIDLVGLTRCEVLANAAVFFSAGYETTATAIQFLFYCLALHPVDQETVSVCGILHDYITKIKRKSLISVLK